MAPYPGAPADRCGQEFTPVLRWVPGSPSHTGVWSSDSAVPTEATLDQVTTTRPTASHRTTVIQL